jgi:hypothetical protein
VVRSFVSLEQEISLLLTVLTDNILEGVESFGIGMSNNIGSVPFLFGEFPSTIVNIVESSKYRKTLIFYCIISLINYPACYYWN